MMTMDELVDRCKKGDPIIDGKYEVQDNRLLVYGSDDDNNFSHDLSITLFADCLGLAYKEPKELLWRNGPLRFYSFETLHTWIYEL